MASKRDSRRTPTFNEARFSSFFTGSGMTGYETQNPSANKTQQTSRPAAPWLRATLVASVLSIFPSLLPVPLIMVATPAGLENFFAEAFIPAADIADFPQLAEA
jgi:hypothetical protein